MLIDNIYNISDLNIHVEYAFRIDRNGRTVIAYIKTTCFLRANAKREFFLAQLLSEFFHQLHPVLFSATSACGSGRTFVGADENVFIENAV